MTVVERSTSGPFTWADLANEPDDGLRREIVGGTLIVNPAPVGRHQLPRPWRRSSIVRRCCS